jgi:hypothetical protein
MKKMLFVILITGLALLVWMPNAHADTPTTTMAQLSFYGVGDSACGVTPGDLAIIKTIQNNFSLGYLDELQQELSARKNLLSKTIRCAKMGAEQAKKDLDNSTIDLSLRSFKNQWSDRLDSAISYYNLQLQKVNEVGISGTEAIAKEVLVWRENNYAPLAENVLNFIMWSDNQGLFTTAANRLAQINNLTNSPLFLESTDVQNDYEEAAVSLRAAEDQNIAAKNAFAQSLSPDRPLLFIKQSLDSLSSTYQHFFDISNLIQSLLPH